MSTSNPSIDVEKGSSTDYAHLTNTSVHSFSWKDVTVTVKDRKTKQPLEILSGVDGIVEAGMYTLPSRINTTNTYIGEMLALMGPRYAVTNFSYALSLVLTLLVALERRHCSMCLHTEPQQQMRQFNKL
jgi:hypothetical protein